MTSFIKIVFLLLILFGLGGRSWAQEYSENNPTENIDAKKDANKKKNQPKRKRIREIYTKDTKKILYGNPCVTESTHKMGFEYVPTAKGQSGYKNEFNRNWHNFWVKAGLVFRRSPFWKPILNGKIKDCRYRMGDYVGV